MYFYKQPIVDILKIHIWYPCFLSDEFSFFTLVVADIFGFISVILLCTFIHLASSFLSFLTSFWIKFIFLFYSLHLLINLYVIHIFYSFTEISWCILNKFKVNILNLFPDKTRNLQDINFLCTPSRLICFYV